MSSRTNTLLLAAAVALSLLLTVPSFADSQARVVRLSDVQGEVQVDRNAGQGFEKAFLNLPIVQGAQLQTGADGRAEVEFEDGSTLHLTPGSTLEFSQLSLRDSGTKLSTIHLQKGTAYVNYSGAKDDEFALTFGLQKLPLNRAAHIRINMADNTATVAVFKGDVQVEDPSGTVAVSERNTATFDLKQNQSTVAKGITPEPDDAWDKQQEQYHQEYASKSYSNYSPYPYGTSDLNYYGSFFNAPGYGMMWQPYFAGAGWDPFMNGAWAYSPGFGYSWVSGYPWGWTPYNYGSWVFLPGRGWAWQPGGVWSPRNAPRVIGAPSHFVTPQAPSGSGQGTIVVSRGPMPVPSGGSVNRLGIFSNSAGLGIPRGAVRNMGDLSHTVQKTGFATVRVHTESAGTSYWHGGSSSAQMGAAHSMTAPRISSSRSGVGHSSAHH